MARGQQVVWLVPFCLLIRVLLSVGSCHAICWLESFYFFWSFRKSAGKSEWETVMLYRQIHFLLYHYIIYPKFTADPIPGIVWFMFALNWFKVWLYDHYFLCSHNYGKYIFFYTFNLKQPSSIKISSYRPQTNNAPLAHLGFAHIWIWAILWCGSEVRNVNDGHLSQFLTRSGGHFFWLEPINA